MSLPFHHLASHKFRLFAGRRLTAYEVREEKEFEHHKDYEEFDQYHQPKHSTIAHVGKAITVKPYDIAQKSYHFHCLLKMLLHSFCKHNVFF